MASINLGRLALGAFYGIVALGTFGLVVMGFQKFCSWLEKQKEDQPK